MLPVLKRGGGSPGGFSGTEPTGIQSRFCTCFPDSSTTLVHHCTSSIISQIDLGQEMSGMVHRSTILHSKESNKVLNCNHFTVKKK